MSSKLKPPIILLGNTRSGTTIVQKVISTHPDVEGWYEPRTMWLCADPGKGHDEFDASDATDKAKRYVRKQFLRFQEQHGSRRVFEKTPANIFKISYVREIFPEASYLFIVRNPFSFISSVELKWQKPVTNKGIKRRLEYTPVSQLHHYAGRLIGDQINKRLLRRKYLKVWGPRYKEIYQDLEQYDQLTVVAKQWAEGSKQAERDLALFKPGEVLRLKYEDFVENPISDIERICAHCGLDVTETMIESAKKWVKADRQTKWRRFDPHDLARIIPILKAEMDRHGYEVPAEIAELVAKMPQTEQYEPVPVPG